MKRANHPGILCPNCGSNYLKKNGHIHNGKQRFKCIDCSRQFVPNATKSKITDQQKEIVDRLLLEKISLAGIARAMNISENWIQNYAKEKAIRTPKKLPNQLTKAKKTSS